MVGCCVCECSVGDYCGSVVGGGFGVVVDCGWV